MRCFVFQNHTRMWVSASPRPARASPRVGVAERSSPAPAPAPALVTGVRLISARLPSSPPQQIPAKTAHQLYPRVPGRTVSQIYLWISYSSPLLISNEVTCTIERLQKFGLMINVPPSSPA